MEMPAKDSSLFQHLVIYDDHCPMCTFQMRLLGWLDLGRRLTFVPLSAAPEEIKVLELKREDLLEAMHTVSPAGSVHRGARAIRYISARVILLWPIFLIMWVPGIIFLCEAIYRLVSRNRYRISKVFGCKSACRIMPEKDRDKD